MQRRRMISGGIATAKVLNGTVRDCVNGVEVLGDGKHRVENVDEVDEASRRLFVPG